MHRLPSWDSRAKPKSTTSSTRTTRSRASSTLSFLQPVQLTARASLVARKVLGPRSPAKNLEAFADPARRASYDKTGSSADCAGPEQITRLRRSTTATCPTHFPTTPKPLGASADDATCSAVPGASNPTFQLELPLHSLLFSPSAPALDDHNQAMVASNERPAAKASPEVSDSGYGSGHSSNAGSAPAVSHPSPTTFKTPRTLGRSVPMPTTPGSMRLSPSVTRLAAPMPILNLPALPPTPTHSHALPRTRSFQPGEMRHVKKAMPALTRHGSSNMHAERPEEDDEDDDASTDGSDVSDIEEASPAEGSSPETYESAGGTIEESTEQSEGEGLSYFDARESHSATPLDGPQLGLNGPTTPRASQQNRTLLNGSSALGLQITPGPHGLGSSPWTLVNPTETAGDVGNNSGTSRADYFSQPVASARQLFKSPHRTPRASELLSLGSSSGVGLAAPHAAPLSPSSIAARRARAGTMLRDSKIESPRPGLYQQASQSMINLSSPPPTEEVALSALIPRSPLITPRDGGLPSPGIPAATLTPRIRRNSMPTTIRHPPAYKELYPALPREEEGKEKLPSYSCGIHIEAMMPRKMEFSAPGVLSKDRAWKKQYVVLHGTSLFIYKHDIRKHPIGGKVKGKERYEGVIIEDEVDLDSPTVHLPGHEPSIPRPPLKSSTPTRQSSSRSGSSLAGTNDNTSRSSLLSRFQGNSSRITVTAPVEPTCSDDKGSSGQCTISEDTTSKGTHPRRWPHNQTSSSFASSLPHFNAPFSSPNVLVRHYSLQRSESGLGSDYYKKRNVIRVRCEGEQFLLQAENVMQVVDWIEALQAGTNVALDLDDRPMTKPPPFPRRRRRRRRPADGSAASETPGSGATPAGTDSTTQNSGN